MQSLDPSPSTEACEQELQWNLQEMLKMEEDMWRCKSRLQWHAMADLNTKYFHLSTMVRRRRNCIEGLKTADGSWIHCREDIGNHFVSSFSDMFTSSSPSLGPEIASLISPVITIEENLALCLIPNESEIWKAMRSIGAFKAPGPDGISALFYHSFWDTVKADFILAVQSFFLLRFSPQISQSC